MIGFYQTVNGLNYVSNWVRTTDERAREDGSLSENGGFVALVLFALVITGALLAIGPSIAAADDPRVGIVGVEVDPDQPYPDESVTITTTIQNADDRDFSIDAVVVEGDFEGEKEWVLNPGAVPPGETFEVPLYATFDEPGTYNLEVEVSGSVDGTEVDRRYPATVTVIDSGPNVTIETEDAVVGEEAGVHVTVSNGEDRPLNNLNVEVGGTSLAAERSRATAAVLPPGESKTFDLTIQPLDDGQTEVTADVSFRTTTGMKTPVTQTKSVEVEPLDSDLALAAETVGEGSSPDLAVSLDNVGNTRVEDAELKVLDADGLTLHRQSVTDVAAGERVSELVEIDHDKHEDLTIRVSYESGRSEQTSEVTATYAPSPASIELTGVDVESTEQPDTVLITGSTSNVGLESAKSVRVRGIETEDVEPVQPNEDFFVGTVGESDFGTFDLNVRLDDGVTEIPVEITYVADGEEHSYVETVPVDTASEPEAGGIGTGTGWQIYALVGGLISLVVLAIMANAIYKSRKDSEDSSSGESGTMSGDGYSSYSQEAEHTSEPLEPESGSASPSETENM